MPPLPDDNDPIVAIGTELTAYEVEGRILRIDREEAAEVIARIKPTEERSLNQQFADWLEQKTGQKVRVGQAAAIMRHVLESTLTEKKSFDDTLKLLSSTESIPSD